MYRTWSSAQSRRRTRCHARGFNSHADPRTPYEPPRRVLPFYRTLFFPDEPTVHAVRIPRPGRTTWRGRFLVRPPRSRGPPPRSRYSPSAGVEPQSAGTHSNITRIKSNHMRLGTHALSLHPPLRAQMSAARGACGRAELALRRRCVGCPAGGAAPRAKGLSGRLARERRCGAAALVNLRAEWSPPALAPAGPG